MEKPNIPFNIIIVLILTFSLLGLYWLDRLGLDAGSAYLWLFMIGGVVFVLIATVAKLAGLDFWYDIPINKTSERGVLMLFFGMLFIGALFGASSITGANIYSPFVMAPLSSFSLSVGAETFSALRTVASPFWTFFITVLSASAIEEFSIGFGFVLMGSLVLGYGLRKLLKLDFGEAGNYLWDFISAIIFSILLFAVLHTFNGTYINADGSMNMGMFIYAGAFRAILNILIYKFGSFGLLFSIGVHAVNNAVYVGGVTVLAALTTFPGGIILSGVLILLVIYMLLSAKEVVKEGGSVAKEFISFD